MPSPLDGILESHEGPEPRVLLEDVTKILRQIVKPGEDDGSAVTMIADRAGVSTRTVYRVLNPAPGKETIGLDLADKMCLACNTHLAYNCRLKWPDGRITDYIGRDV